MIRGEDMVEDITWNIKGIFYPEVEHQNFEIFSSAFLPYNSSSRDKLATKAKKKSKTITMIYL